MILKRRLIHGFTLIELVLVILIIGILAVTLLPQWTATTIDLNFEANRVLNDVRYAQGLSITSGQRYRWVELSANSYQITNQAGSPLILPNGSTQLTLTSGVVFGTLGNLPSNLIAFDSQGTPYSNSATPGTALSSTATIPISGGGATRTISINPGTGSGVLQ